MPRWIPKTNSQELAESTSGPAIARVFHSGLGGIFAIAWLSLAVQVRPLIGLDGLEPARDLFQRLSGTPEAGFWDAPSLFWLSQSDTVLLGGCGVGVLLSIMAACGIRPRLLHPLSALLYLSYIHAAPTFLGFQWDNLLVEAGLLAALLSPRHPSQIAHLAFRVLLFKIFFESGLAKWASPQGDWLDGSAMASYYQTAPLPTPLALLFHHLPPWWHALESWATLAFELGLSVCIFAGYRLRSLAFSVFILFLILDFATANYGIFIPLSALLCLFLLPDRHAGLLLRVLRRPPLHDLSPRQSRRRFGPGLIVSVWVCLSVQAAVARFADRDPAPSIRNLAQTLRIANVYHLFGTVTTTRLEPEFQTSPDGESWTPHALTYKPGPETRRPPLVAPHQPRLDFQLWFYALSWQHRTPAYVVSLVRSLCHAPERVQPFFPKTLPTDTAAVRIVFHDTRFVTLNQRHEDGVWWHRYEQGATRTLPCTDIPIPTPGADR